VASKRLPPGAVWRVVYDGSPTKHGGMYGEPHHLVSADYPVSDIGTPPRYKRVKQRTIINEMVISPWLHVEQMNGRQWFIGLLDKKVMVTIKGGIATLGEWYE